MSGSPAGRRPSARSGRARPALAVALAIFALALAATLGACQSAQPQLASGGPKPVPTAGPLGLPGRLVYPSGNRLVSLEIATRSRRNLAELPADALVGGLAVSHDGRLVFSVYRPTGRVDDPGGADLYLLAPGAGEPRLLLARDGPGVSLGEPAWSADGQSIYFTRWGRRQEGGQWRQEIRIERIGLDGSDRRTVVENATSPTLSADGQLLAYLSPPPGPDSSGLWVASADGERPRRVAGPGFTQMRGPRFAPDRPALVFAAVGEPAGSTSERGAARPALDRLLGVPIAAAHGIPWDLWLVDAEGTGLARLTDVAEDSPLAAWSPDGAWIAFSGEAGLYLVDLSARTTVKLTDDQSGEVVWPPG